jgi:hypothetical protein
MTDDDWVSYLKFNRNLEKEKELYYDVIGLTDGHEYILRSAYSGSLPNSVVHHDIDVGVDTDIVDVCFIDGFTLIDWCMVMENAKKIHTMNTSINFILETLDLTCEEYVIYARDRHNLKQINYLFKKQDRFECI